MDNKNTQNKITNTLITVLGVFFYLVIIIGMMCLVNLDLLKKIVSNEGKVELSSKSILITIDALITTATITLIAFNGIGARNSGSSTIIRIIFWKAVRISTDEKRTYFSWSVSGAFLRPALIILLTTSTTFSELIIIEACDLSEKIFYFIVNSLLALSIILFLSTFARLFIFNGICWLETTATFISKRLCKDKKPRQWLLNLLTYFRGSNNFELVNKVIEGILKNKKAIEINGQNPWGVMKYIQENSNSIYEAESNSQQSISKLNVLVFLFNIIEANIEREQIQLDFQWRYDVKIKKNWKYYRIKQLINDNSDKNDIIETIIKNMEVVMVGEGELKGKFDPQELDDASLNALKELKLSDETLSNVERFKGYARKNIKAPKFKWSTLTSLDKSKKRHSVKSSSKTYTIAIIDDGEKVLKNDDFVVYKKMPNKFPDRKRKSGTKYFYFTDKKGIEKLKKQKKT